MIYSIQQTRVNKDVNVRVRYITLITFFIVTLAVNLYADENLVPNSLNYPSLDIYPGSGNIESSLDWTTAGSTPSYIPPPPPPTCQDWIEALPYAELSDKIYEDNTGSAECKPEGDWKCIDNDRAPMVIKLRMDNGTPELVPDYSKLNPKIHDFAQGNISSWEFYNAPQPKTLNPELYKYVDDPISFHAKAYKKNGKIAIVFEGTTSYKDWYNNLSHVVSEPPQYEAALEFAQKIIDKECLNNESQCKENIIVTGHSLGGGLAQYVARTYGLTAYTFNSAGLFPATIIKSSQSGNTKLSNITHFMGQGYLDNKKHSFHDCVAYLGFQFEEKDILVRIDLPHLLGPKEFCLKIHNSGNMLNGIQNYVLNCKNNNLNSNPLIIRAPHVKVALVIDRSGSMKEILKNPDNSQAEKLLKAKQATKAFILAMNETDQVSISTFSDKASTQQNMVTAPQARQTLDQTLSQIEASGATNIGAGLEQGYQQLSNSGAGSTGTTLLLSDGKNNRGDWKPVVKKYIDKNWSICTIGFGKDADEKTLRKIAEDTGCTYAQAETFDLVVKYQKLGAYVKGESHDLATSDLLAINDTLIYEFVVSRDAEYVSAYTSWQGSLLKTVLISPDGRRINAEQLVEGMGRYIQGDTFQLLEISAPQPGRWKIETSWAVPPPIPEQVNILVTEKSDVFSRILSFRPQYSIGEPVIINVEVKELIGNKKTLANQASVNVKIQKPGAQMIRMVQAQSTNWTMYKDVVVDVTRELELFDDGMHDDYKPGDGIYGNSFRETDKQGAYLVTATVNGQMRNGQSFEKSMLASLQVGQITQNKVTTSQTLQYVSEASYHIDNTSPYAKEIFNQPMEEINDMQGLDMLDGVEMLGEDPLDSIEEMMNAQ